MKFCVGECYHYKTEFFQQLVWITPVDRAEHKVMYDSSMCVLSGGDAEAKRLMAKAFKETLSLPQQQHLLAELDKDPRMVYHTGLTPPKVSPVELLCTSHKQWKLCIILDLSGLASE